MLRVGKKKQLCRAGAGVADRVAAGIGGSLLDATPGTLTTACDPRLARDVEAQIDRSRRLVGLHASRGHHRRVTITLPATWEGLQAAAQLRRDGIPTNIDHVFSVIQVRLWPRSSAMWLHGH